MTKIKITHHWVDPANDAECQFNVTALYQRREPRTPGHPGHPGYADVAELGEPECVLVNGDKPSIAQALCRELALCRAYYDATIPTHLRDEIDQALIDEGREREGIARELAEERGAYTNRV